MLTADKNIQYQQNLNARKIVIVVLTQLRRSIGAQEISCNRRRRERGERREFRRNGDPTFSTPPPELNDLTAVLLAIGFAVFGVLVASSLIAQSGATIKSARLP